VGAFALAHLHGSVAHAVGTARARRAPAVGVAIPVAAAGYVVQGLLSLSDAVAPPRLVSPWHWYLGRNMLTDGVAPDALVVPLVLSVVLASTSVPIFARRRAPPLGRPVAIVDLNQDDEEAT
jgi:ABC-2 type transport system permease protein